MQCAAKRAKFIGRAWSVTRKCPSSTRGGGHRGMLVQSRGANSPAMAFIHCNKHSVAWLDPVRIPVDKYCAALLISSRGTQVLVRAPLLAQTRLDNISYVSRHTCLHGVLVAIVARASRGGLRRVCPFPCYPEFSRRSTSRGPNRFRPYANRQGLSGT